MDTMKPGIPEHEPRPVGSEVVWDMGALASLGAAGKGGETVDDFVLPNADVGDMTLAELIESGLPPLLAENLVRQRDISNTTAGWNSAM